MCISCIFTAAWYLSCVSVHVSVLLDQWFLVGCIMCVPLPCVWSFFSFFFLYFAILLCFVSFLSSCFVFFGSSKSELCFLKHKWCGKCFYYSLISEVQLDELSKKSDRFKSELCSAAKRNINSSTAVLLLCTVEVKLCLYNSCLINLLCTLEKFIQVYLL